MATTTPVIATPRSAINLKNMNMSPMRVPSFVDMQFRSVTNTTAPMATPLLIQGLMCSTSAPTNARTVYSPKIMAMIAAEPGLSTHTADQVKRKPMSSPNILARYTCAPPFKGIAPPSSA
jgi:hypothetical protein